MVQKTRAGNGSGEVTELERIAACIAIEAPLPVRQHLRHARGHSANCPLRVRFRNVLDAIAGLEGAH